MKYVEHQGKRYLVLDDRKTCYLVCPAKKDGTRNKKGGFLILDKSEVKVLQ